jgi:hypothetical protein
VISSSASSRTWSWSSGRNLAERVASNCCRKPRAASGNVLAESDWGFHQSVSADSYAHKQTQHNGHGMLTVSWAERLATTLSACG